MKLNLQLIVLLSHIVLESSCLKIRPFLHNKVFVRVRVLTSLQSSKGSTSVSYPTQQSTAQPPALVLNDLTCSHDGGMTYQLDKVSYILPRFAKVGLVGRNGYGKSTLLRILQKECVPTITKGLDFMYDGSIEKGKDIYIVSLVE